MRLFELTDLADSTIAELEADGVRVYPQDVLAIQALSLKATGGGRLLKGRPRVAGCVVFWPLTIGASTWLSHWLAHLEERGAFAYSRAFDGYAYASAHARESITVFGDEATAAVEKWRASLAITEAELLDAVAGVMSESGGILGNKGEELTSASFDVDDLLTMAIARVGGDVDALRWLLSIAEVEEAVNTSLSISAAERGLSNKGNDETLRGLKELAEYTRKMRERPKDGKKD